MKRISHILRLLIFSLILVSNLAFNENAYAQTTNYKAYSLFTYNFIKNAHWPETYESFVIRVIGKSKIYNELVGLALTKTVEGKKIEVIQADDYDASQTTQIIFLSDGSSSSLKGLIEKTKGKSILLITEREGLINKGACISFIVLESGALRFQVNEAELTSRNIQLSNGLMSLALK